MVIRKDQAEYDALLEQLDSQWGDGRDATKATREKGGKFLSAVIDGLIELIREFRATDKLPRYVISTRIL